eukprot:Gb_18888 [translate_table: standard]
MITARSLAFASSARQSCASCKAASLCFSRWSRSLVRSATFSSDALNFNAADRSRSSISLDKRSISAAAAFRSLSMA